MILQKELDLGILVTGRCGVQQVVDDLELFPHIVISITSDDQEQEPIISNSNTLEILRMSFYDLEKSKGDHNAITREQAKEILDFYNKHKDKAIYIVCQCDAGISRSAGTAAALSKIKNGEDGHYFKVHLPNSLVYRTILEEHYKVLYYDNGEPIIQNRIQDEVWYPVYQELCEFCMGISDSETAPTGKEILELFTKDYEEDGIPLTIEKNRLLKWCELQSKINIDFIEDNKDEDWWINRHKKIRRT